MPNAHIEIYNAERQQGTHYAPAIDAALNSLKHDFEKRQSTSQLSVSQSTASKERFFDARKRRELRTIEKNLELITQIQTGIKSLANDNDVNEIVPILVHYFKEISHPKTHELVTYLIESLSAINYTTRDSNLITPSPIEVITKLAEPYVDGQQWNLAFKEILKKKNLDYQRFTRQPDAPLNLQSDLSEHAKWALNAIYRVAYPHAKSIPEAKNSGIARYCHGIQHVSRAALYVQVFANLYRKHGDEEAARLSDEDVKLLQIAALFHDSAREDEGMDRWDHESAVLLYHYLTQILGVDRTKAKLIAEATANKDPSPAQGYFEIIDTGPNTFMWCFNKFPSGTTKKNIYQKIIHDADSLDIIRARRLFDANYLDFYKEIAGKKGHTLALEEIALLICEARSLIEIQGDSFLRTKPEVKKDYEHEDVYNFTLADLNEEIHPILSLLGKKLLSHEELQAHHFVDLSPYDKARGVTVENMKAAIREGRVFSQGIATPSAIAKLYPDNPQELETWAALKIRKVFRELNVPTRSQKANNRQKQGDPLQSVSMLGYGSGVLTNAGFLIVEPEIEAISQIATQNLARERDQKDKSKEDKLPRDMVEIKLGALHDKLKLGGETAYFYSSLSTRVDITYDITHYNAIYFSDDPNFYNFQNTGSAEAVHRFSPLLQALYLRNQYGIQYQKTRADFIQAFGESEGTQKLLARFGERCELPLFYYSGLHHCLEAVPESELTDEKIVARWIEMCSDYMNQELSNVFEGKDIVNMSLEDIKINSMYKPKESPAAQNRGPADTNYAAPLREQINVAIEKARKETIHQHKTSLIEKIQHGDILSDETFYYLLRNPALLDTFLVPIRKGVERALQQGVKNLFSSKAITEFFDNELSKQRGSSFVNELPTDLKPILMATLEQKQVYFETPMSRLYFLSKQLGWDEPQHQIQGMAKPLINQALEEVHKLLTELKSNGDFPLIVEKIIHLNKLITSLGLDLNFKTLLDEIKVALFQHVTQLEMELGKRRGLNCDFRTYVEHSSVIKCFQELGWFTQEHQHFVETLYLKQLCSQLETVLKTSNPSHIQDLIKTFDAEVRRYMDSLNAGKVDLDLITQLITLNQHEKLPSHAERDLIIEKLKKIHQIMQESAPQPEDKPRI